METMSCIEEAMWILEVLDSLNIKNSNKEIWVSFTLNDNGYLRSGESINDGIKQICIQNNQYNLNITTIDMNCCLPEAVDLGLNQILNNEKILRSLAKNNLKISIYPNFMESIKHINSSDGVIGGCCGVEPAHIKYMVSKIGAELSASREIQSKL